MEATANILLEKWRKNKDELYPVKLRVTHDRKSKYYSIRHFVKNNEWAFCKSQKELNDIRNVTKEQNKIFV